MGEILFNIGSFFLVFWVVRKLWRKFRNFLKSQDGLWWYLWF